ncbi:MAG: glycosyltransferase 87 family protein [Pseudomonadota bacterium]
MRHQLPLRTALIGIPVASGLIAVLSPAWTRGTTTADHPVLALVLLLGTASLIWLVMLWAFTRSASSRSTSNVSSIFLVALFLSGLIARLFFFGSTPVYEDDWERYLWGGAVTAQGLNPYAHSPEEVMLAAEPGTASQPDLARLALLSTTADGTVEQINNASLTTLYPPVAQAAFALAHWIDPFGEDGLRIVFLLSDLAALILLRLALARWGRPQSWAAIYWLNPVLIFTVYSGLHMDILLMAPMLAALILAKTRPLFAGLALSLAAGIKMWPLLLAPLLFRHLRTRPARLIIVGATVTAASLFLFTPLLLSLSPESGLSAYASGWVNSSFLFPGLREALSLISDTPDPLARYTVALILVLASLGLGLLAPDDDRAVPVQALGLIALLIWLSPTGYPWYLIWLLPFLALAPRLWVGAVFVGATAYYGRFWLGEADLYSLYTLGLVPLWFGLPLLLFALQWRQPHDRRA